MIAVDFHTHSSASPDGSISAAQYKRLLQRKLQCIAVTDHDTIDGALALQREIGDAIIVGQEITTAQGELIGLFLQTAIPAGLSAAETAKQIKAQGGVVYVPHPFETVRKGVSVEVLDEIAKLVDVIEVCNGRAVFQNKGQQAKAWAEAHNIAQASASDAHGLHGLGRTYTLLHDFPTATTLAGLLRESTLVTRKAWLPSLLYPKINRLRKGLS